MTNPVKLTQEGYREIERRLEQEQLRLEEATRILQEQMEATSDSEDTGLEEAKREKLQIESRIAELQDYLNQAVIIQKVNKDTISLGSLVTLRNETVGREMQVKVVSGAEASVVSGQVTRISDDSPVGLKLMGKKAGATFVVDLENGKQVKYTVLSLE